MRLKQLIQSSLACIVAVGLLAVPAIAMAGDIHTSDMLDTDTASITKLKEDGLVSGTAPFDKDDQPGDDSTPDNTIIRSFDTATYGISYTVTPDDMMAYYRQARIGFTFTLPVDKSVAGFDVDSMLWTDKTPGFEPKINDKDGVQTLTCYRLLTPTGNNPTSVPGTSAVTLVIKVKAAKNETVIQPSVNSWVAWDKSNPTNIGTHQAGDTFTNLWTDGDNKVNQIVSRSVSGVVWIDRDKDGSRGTGTSDVSYSDAHATLVDKNGNTVTYTTG